MNDEELKRILQGHSEWLADPTKGHRANLSQADLSGANLSLADLSLADLSRADLSWVNLSEANLSGANLSRANLSRANLYRADLSGATNLAKVMGVGPGNRYWKRFETGLNNQGYQFKIGLNELRNSEVFASDERQCCSYPGFHFASRSWCAINFPDRPLEALIQIPFNAKINEPWTTDGNASADKIIILQVFDVATGKDVTDQFREAGAASPDPQSKIPPTDAETGNNPNRPTPSAAFPGAAISSPAPASERSNPNE
ncbi:MAG: pentapeptide repeat-containing protein [bacterium]